MGANGFTGMEAGKALGDAIATAFGEQLGYLDGQVQRRLEVNYRSEQVRVGATFGETSIEVLSFPSAMLFRLTPN